MEEEAYQKALADVEQAWKDQMKYEAEQAKATAEKIAAAEKEQAIKDAELKAANVAAAKAQKELEEKKAAEAKVEQDRLAEGARVTAEAKKAAKAPDKEKLGNAIADIKIVTPELKTEEAKKVYIELLNKLAAYKQWANQQIATL